VPPPSPTGAWVFVSHSSADLANVRKVRNYLEEQGAAPLLFHLISLRNPEEFWPVIEREIQERNFFLYCESNEAERSEWVRKERQAVERTRSLGPGKSIRIGHVRVDTRLDTAALDEFIEKTRVFPSYAVADRERVKPYLTALTTAGFQVFDPLTDRKPGWPWVSATDLELTKAAKKGWVVIFVSRTSNTSPRTMREAKRSLDLGGMVVPVLLDSPEAMGISADSWSSGILKSCLVDSEDGPARLARVLHER
jgi:hypothetical protein